MFPRNVSLFFAALGSAVALWLWTQVPILRAYRQVERSLRQELRLPAETRLELTAMGMDGRYVSEMKYFWVRVFDRQGGLRTEGAARATVLGGSRRYTVLNFVTREEMRRNPASLNLFPEDVRRRARGG